MRRVLLALLLGTTLVLTACGSESDQPEASSDCGAEPGKASDAVEVTGDFGKEQLANFDTPLKVDGVERTVVIEGDGEEIADDAKVEVKVSLLKGTDAELLQTGDFSFGVDDEQMPASIRDGIDCMKIGTRFVLVAQAGDLLADGGAGAELEATDAVVTIMDLIGIEKPAEAPKPSNWQNPPTVEFNDDGEPTLTLSGNPAKDYQLAVLEEGDGDVIATGDDVTLHYQGTSWDTGEIFDSSWERGQAATFNTGEVVPGFAGALVGQKVGTRLVVTIPPALAYGEDKAAGGLAGQTLVFVVDIESIGD